MRFFYLSILCFFSYSSLFAQIELAPLGSNSVLQAHQAKNGKSNPQENIQARVTSNHCDEPTTVLFEESTTVFVVSGEEVMICIDDFLFDNLNTTSCKNCDSLLFGSVTIDNPNFCYTYLSDASITLNTADTIKIEACDDYGCEELVFPIVIKRANQDTILPLINFTIESINTICLDTITLPGQERNFSFLGCQNGVYGQLSLPDSCFEYTTFRFQELDEICIEVCDEYCVCDTYTFPIKINGPSLSLPFFDDFSNTGPYPDGALWLDDKVYVNDHLAFQAPSVGVASFDGLDEGGAPYGGGFGPADVLTSGYIDLSSFDSTSNVYLSYYIQPKGISTFFPKLFDSLSLEFRNMNEEWVLIESYDGLASSTPPLVDIPFSELKSHNVTDSDFFHDRFQFRFTSHNKRNGMQSLWHLDYVRLNAIEIPDGTFADIAFTAIPSSLLNRYRHMPWHQFKESDLTEVLNIGLFNHNANTASIISSTVSLFEKSTNTAIVIGKPELLNLDTTITVSIIVDTIIPNPTNLDTIFFEISNTDPLITEILPYLTKNVNPLIIDTTFFRQVSGINQANVFPQLHKAYTNKKLFPAFNNSFPTNSKDLVFEMSYNMIGGSSQNSTVFPATSRNDTVRTEIHFSNYFAYDDGSPESVVTGNQNNLQMATRFRANVADSLAGVQFNFPYTENVINADFVIKVWLDDINNSESPIYTSPTLSPIIANQFYDTLNAFTTYNLVSETLEDIKIPIPEGDFFVGIQQVSTSGRIGIGFDQNTKDNTNQFFRAPGSAQVWRNFFLPGALMIRPIVGAGESPVTTATEEVAKISPSLEVKVFPNPTQGLLFLPVNQENTEDLEMMIVSSNGQVLLQQNWQAQIDLNNWSNGLYFLHLRDTKTGAQVKKKFLILR